MSKRYRISLITGVCWLALAACGVEVGNPNPTKPTTTTSGSVQIYMSRVPRTAAESLTLALGGISLDSQVSELPRTELNPKLPQFDLYDQDTSDLLLAEASGIAVGEYSGLTLNLTQTTVDFRDADGRSGQAELDSVYRDDTGIIIGRAIVISEGETTPILIDLDPRRSLFDGEGEHVGKRRFRPMGGALARHGIAAYEGVSVVNGGQWVCAYLYEPRFGKPLGAPQRPHAQPLFEHRPRPSKLPAFLSAEAPADGRPPRLRPQERPYFSTAAEVVKDETAGCENAFAKEPVFEQKFAFPRLPPGTYDFRVFAQDGSYQEQALGVYIDPPAPPP